MLTARHEITDGGCVVELAMSDGVGELINLKLLCADEAQAKLMEKNFRLDAESYYQKIIELMSEV